MILVSFPFEGCKVHLSDGASCGGSGCVGVCRGRESACVVQMVS